MSSLPPSSTSSAVTDSLHPPAWRPRRAGAHQGASVRHLALCPAAPLIQAVPSLGPYPYTAGRASGGGGEPAAAGQVLPQQRPSWTQHNGGPEHSKEAAVTTPGPPGQVRRRLGHPCASLPHHTHTRYVRTLMTSVMASAVAADLLRAYRSAHSCTAQRPAASQVRGPGRAWAASVSKRKPCSPYRACTLTLAHDQSRTDYARCVLFT
jgi:hypothetical protein